MEAVHSRDVPRRVRSAVAALSNHEVFRHPGNRKWFALMMEVPGEKLGLPERGMLDILNLKCDPVLIASLRGAPGLLPAYHMNKENWITAVLDSGAPDAQIRTLLAMEL